MATLRQRMEQELLKFFLTVCTTCIVYLLQTIPAVPNNNVYKQFILSQCLLLGSIFNCVYRPCKQVPGAIHYMPVSTSKDTQTEA